MTIRFGLAVLVMAFSGHSMAKVKTEIVDYKHGDTVLEGYLAYDPVKVKRGAPGVLIVHEWTGLGGYVRNRAEQLAEMGYVAFAADIYGKGIRPATPDAAGKEAAKYKGNRTLMRERVMAGLDALKGRKEVSAEKIAAIGYCFGGTTVLELARAGADVKGVVSFHGGLDSPSPADGKNIKAKVLVLHGADDPYVPAKDLAAFEDEMRKGGVDWQLVKYSKAVHAFTNRESGNDPSKGAAYNADADRRSWEDMKQFFREIL